MNRAIFLDRDGTINEDVGSLCEPDKFVFIPQAIEALKILQERFLLFVVTNQSAIAKGIFSQAAYLKFNDYFKSQLKNKGIDIKEILHCPHTKEEACLCHKPGTYFIEQLYKNYDIDVKNSFCIGDHPHDIEMAHKVGAGSVYLLTGHGAKHKKELLSEPNYIAGDLYAAALWIINRN